MRDTKQSKKQRTRRLRNPTNPTTDSFGFSLLLASVLWGGAAFTCVLTYRKGTKGTGAIAGHKEANKIVLLRYLSIVAFFVAARVGTCLGWEL